VNPLQTTDSGGFVTGFNPTGSALVYSTYLGSEGGGVAVDSAGNVYVTGDISGGFPTTQGAFQTVCNSISSCAFVTKIASEVTFANLIKLVKQFDTKRDLAAIMVFTLELAQAAEQAHAAKVADALLDAFIDEVSEQSGKSLTAAEAAILIQYATALKM
jgi:hypothetical protein